MNMANTWRLTLAKPWPCSRLRVAVVLSVTLACSAVAADLATARKEFLGGAYTKCATLCEQAIAEREYEEEWRVLLVRSLCAVGKYEQAGLVLSNALDRYAWSIPLRLRSIAIRHVRNYSFCTAGELSRSAVRQWISDPARRIQVIAAVGYGVSSG